MATALSPSAERHAAAAPVRPIVSPRLVSGVSLSVLYGFCARISVAKNFPGTDIGVLWLPLGLLLAWLLRNPVRRWPELDRLCAGRRSGRRGGAVGSRLDRADRHPVRRRRASGGGRGRGGQEMVGRPIDERVGGHARAGAGRRRRAGAALRLRQGGPPLSLRRLTELLAGVDLSAPVERAVGRRADTVPPVRVPAVVPLVDATADGAALRRHASSPPAWSPSAPSPSCRCFSASRTSSSSPRRRCRSRSGRRSGSGQPASARRRCCSRCSASTDDPKAPGFRSARRPRTSSRRSSS